MGTKSQQGVNSANGSPVFTNTVFINPAGRQ